MILYCSSGLFTTHMLQPILACDFLRGCDSSINFASWFSDVDADPCLPITVIPPWDQRLRLCTPWKGFDVLFFVCFPHSGPTAVLIEVQPGKRDQRRCSIQPWESQGLISDEWSLWCLCAFTQLSIYSNIYTSSMWQPLKLHLWQNYDDGNQTVLYYTENVSYPQSLCTWNKQRAED